MDADRLASLGVYRSPQASRAVGGGADAEQQKWQQTDAGSAAAGGGLPPLRTPGGKSTAVEWATSNCTPAWYLIAYCCAVAKRRAAANGYVTTRSAMTTGIHRLYIDDKWIREA